MPNNIDLLRELLVQVYARRPALKKKMLKTMTDVLLTTPPDRLPNISCLGGEIEQCFVDILTKYVKRNPPSEGDLSSICRHASQICDTTLDILNTKMSFVRCIQQGYNSSFTNPDVIQDRIVADLLGEENAAR
jgi:hypothetical protein